MLSKRRVRFSIGAMLVVMTIVAVLLNHEVQRAKAIETTEKKIKEWQGQVFFRPRANTSSFLANVLPQYWTAEIVGIDIASYRYGRLVIDNQVKDTFIDRLDFERVVELGALENLQFADFSGPAIRYAHITSVCEAASMRQCNLFDASITADEFENLKQAYPSITFQTPSRFLE